MTKASLHLALLAATLGGVLASPAQAQMRVFVGAQGADGNPCSFAQPCRTFQHAHDVAAPGAEINVLDPAGYGPLTITKSTSIQGHGFAGISVASGADGIRINASRQDDVSLDGLVIDGGNAGLNGIVFSSGYSLTIANCTVRRMTNHGLAVRFSLAGGFDQVPLAVSDSTFSRNGGDGANITPQLRGEIAATFDRVRFYGNANGLVLDGRTGTPTTIVASVTDSIAANSRQGAGFIATSTSPSHGEVTLILSQTKSFNNHYGLIANSDLVRVYFAQTTSSNFFLDDLDDDLALTNLPFIWSYGDNHLDNRQRPLKTW